MTDHDKAELLQSLWLPETEIVGNFSTKNNFSSKNFSIVKNSSLLTNRTHLLERTNSSEVWLIILLLFPAFTIFGNILVVLAIRKEKSLQTVTNYFIVSLAVADILVATIVMPISVYVEVRKGVWDFGEVLCDIWIMCDALFCTASILNLVAISIDRYVAVTKPIQYMKHKNLKRTIITIGGTWLLSIAIALPTGCGMNKVETIRKKFPGVCIFFNGDFLIYSSLGSFYIPCIIMAVLYYRIFIVIWQRAKKSSWLKKGKTIENRKVTGNFEKKLQQYNKYYSDTTNRLSGETAQLVTSDHADASDIQSEHSCENKHDKSLHFESKSLSKTNVENKVNKKYFLCSKTKKKLKKRKDRSAARREKKATKTLAIVLGVFLLCWLPFFTLNLLWAVCLKNINNEMFEGPFCQFDRKVSSFIVWLGYINSFLNPLIYTIFNNEFRKTFKKLLTCNKKK